MIKVLGISGSPRRHSNTEILLDRALDGARSEGAVTEKIIISELCLEPCRGCYGCLKKGVCIIKDDIHAIYRKIREADRIIIASPVYFGSLTAQLKIMIDRFQSQWIKKYVLKMRVSNKKHRRGAFLCAAGEKKDKFFRNAREIIRFFFTTLDIKYSEGLFCGGVEKAGQISQMPAALDRAFNIGVRLVRKVKI